jgi:rare lipoprotein A
MKMGCLSENQSRECVRHWKWRPRSPFIPVQAALATIFMVSCLACQAADLASWYGEKHRGLLMANGQRFDPDKCTAASWFYDIGTKVVVTHENRSVIVEITDRGPAKFLLKKGRIIDLSRAAFAKLADPDLGLIDVTVRKQ